MALINSVGKKLSGRSALITGASRGIGLAIAEAYAEHGANLVLSATNETSLEQAKMALSGHDVKISIFCADLIFVGFIRKIGQICVDLFEIQSNFYPRYFYPG